MPKPESATYFGSKTIPKTTYKQEKELTPRAIIYCNTILLGSLEILSIVDI